MTTNHEMRMNADSFAKIASGSKTIEARLHDEKRRLIKAGDTVTIVNREDETTLHATVVEIVSWPTFKDLFIAMTPEAIGHKNISDCELLYQYYSREEEELLGVVGIVLKDISV